MISDHETSRSARLHGLHGRLHVADCLQQQQLWICADMMLTRRAWLLLLTWQHEQEAVEDTDVAGDVSCA